MDAHAEAIPWGRALSPRAERAAVSGALRGDPAALAVLFRAHWPSAYRSAWLIVRDEHAAEDLAQEGFVAAFGALDRFDRSRPFGPWLRTIVARRAIDATRARATRREVDGSVALALEPAPEEQRVAPGTEILAAVAALPDEQRAVVVLRHLLELTPSEIAAVVGVPTGTVNSRLRRGLDALAKTLAAALVVLAVVLGLALTQPGRATAEWVRDHLSKVTGQSAPVAPRPVGGYRTLPGGGRLLSVTEQGVFAFGIAAAPRQLLGHADAAAWSPHGRFAAAVRGSELIAVDLGGHRRWHVAAAHPIASVAWSPSGYRVAYVEGRRTIHVVAGDGTGDRVLAASGAAAPAWQPGVAPAERLATVDSANRVVLRDADTRAVLWRHRPPTRPRALAWSASGRRLLVLQRDRATTLDAATGRTVGSARAPIGTFNVRLAARPHGGGYAVVRALTADAPQPSPPPATLPTARVDLVRPGGATSAVLFATGPIRAIAFSPRGDWLAADRAGVDGWDLLRLAGGRVDRQRTLAAGRGARLSGWCCG
jgi:RNA polymerase sigma-70 factor (ECF subfamily)